MSLDAARHRIRAKIRGPNKAKNDTLDSLLYRLTVHMYSAIQYACQEVGEPEPSKNLTTATEEFGQSNT